MPGINYFSKNNITDPTVKKKGCYEYTETKYACIKKVVSKQGGFLVNINLGNKKIWDEKTRSYKYKKQNTVKHVFTEKEALDLLADAQKYRKGEQDNRSKFIDKISMEQLIKDYMDSPRFSNMSDTYREHQENIIRHILDYFPKENDKYVCDLSTNDIEMYFDYQLKNGNRRVIKQKGEEIIRADGGISVNTIHKHKSVLKAIFEFALSCGKKYGIERNIVIQAHIPKVKVVGSNKPVSVIEHYAKSLTLDELNITLQDAVEKEMDHSIVLLIALGALGGLRCSEIAGLEVGDFFHDERMDINEQLMNKFQYSIPYYKSNNDLMFVDKAIKYIYGKEVTQLPKGNHPRITAIPEDLRVAVDYCLKQREGLVDNHYFQRLYNPLVYVVKGRYIPLKKIYRKWMEYQNRRNRRLKLQGKEPIKIIDIHELRHTHVSLLEGAYPGSLNISWNVGHLIPIKNTTAKYAHEPEPKRDEIIKFFNENIKIDWSKACNNFITLDDIRFNGSGHIRTED